MEEQREVLHTLYQNTDPVFFINYWERMIDRYILNYMKQVLPRLLRLLVYISKSTHPVSLFNV